MTYSHKNVTIRLIGQVPTVPINSIVKIIGGFSMEETTFNMEGYILCIEAAADRAVFFEIPKFQQLRKERIAAEEKFSAEQQERLKEAKKLLSNLSDVATEVFGTEFPVKEVCTENYEESFRELFGLVTKAYMQTLRMSFIQRKSRTKKFRKAMEERFGIKTDEKDSYEVFRSLLAVFSSKYRRIFNGIWDEYYKEVTKRQKAEEEAKKCVINTLSHIPTRDLVPMWKEGREEDVISNCADVVAEYQAYVQGIPKAGIKEVTCGFQYYNKDKKAWEYVNRGVIKYNEEQKCWRYDVAV